MAKITLNDGFELSDYGSPYFIAELNSSHNGNIETAKRMIDEAKKSGCNCVKFQSWTPETLYSKSYYDANPIAKRMVTKFSMSEAELREAAEYCKEVEIGFSSTPYSRSEVDFLSEMNVPFIKIASMEINNYPFLKYIGEKGLPIIMSTGMADIEEIKKAVSAIASTGNRKLALLHCVSIYPSSAEMTNLNNMLLLRESFPDYPIGYSDHTLGIEVPCAAVAMGACLIEKHFTLDSSKMGWDNSMAMEPQQLEQLIIGCRNVNKALGTKERLVSDAEIKQRENMRRSLIYTANLKAGHILTPEDTDAKRPGTGLAPEMIDILCGKSLTKDVEKDTLIHIDDLK